MKIVEKKIRPRFFNEVLLGNKNFEIRKDEDDIEVEDLLILREWDGEYTGRSITKTVLYVLRNAEEFGLKEGYCIISLGEY